MKKLSALLLSLSLIFTAIPAYNNTYAEVSKNITQEIDLTKQYEVSEVIDGDTIKIKVGDNEVKVRLLQVDTPESKHPDESKNVPMGKKATEFTANFLKNKKVRLETDVEPYDKYGRLLAYVYVKDDKGNEICLNQALIENSLAKTVKYGKNIKNYEKYLEIERKLRDKKQGIWENIQANYPSNAPTPEQQKQKSKETKAQNQTKQKTQTNTQKSTNNNTQKQKNDTVTNVNNSNTTTSHQGKIKGNINSKKEKIYHVPGGAYYDRTIAEEYFDTEEEAQAAGYRKSKR